MTWTCRTREKTITNRKSEHCPVCHETFTGTRAGDTHRVGRHGVSDGPDRRRCLTPAEMEAKGRSITKDGHWDSGRVFPDSL